MKQGEKTKFSKKALENLKRRREIRELIFKLYGEKWIKKIMAQ